MNTLLNIRHWPLRLKVAQLFFVSPALPLALLAARADEVEGRLNAFHRMCQRASWRVAHMPDVLRYPDATPAIRMGLAPAVAHLLAVWLAAGAGLWVARGIVGSVKLVADWS